MKFWQALWFEIGIDAPQAVGVVLASCVLYLAFTTVLRVWLLASVREFTKPPCGDDGFPRWPWVAESTPW